MDTVYRIDNTYMTEQLQPLYNLLQPNAIDILQHIQPANLNSDIKRDLQPMMNQLQHNTKSAIHTLIKQKLNSSDK